jgi:hypothetical protein
LIKQKEKELDKNRKIASGVIELIKNSIYQFTKTLKIRSFNPSLEVTNKAVLFLNKLESPCYYISALLRTFALRLLRWLVCNLPNVLNFEVN